MKLENKKIGLMLITVISLISVIIFFLIGPQSQDPKYHDFCDIEPHFGITNFFNVVTNIPFFFVGILGIQWLKKTKKNQLKQEIWLSYFVLFTGVCLLAIGSSYYHLSPKNETLVWDRLSMTIVFMALFSIIIGEFISVNLGKPLLITLLILGLSSVVYWDYYDDLRFYGIVQYLPMLLIPIILLFFKQSFTLISGYWLLFGSYVLAKIFEEYDSRLCDIIPFLSGHSLKHLVAAFGVFLLTKSYMNRKST